MKREWVQILIVILALFLSSTGFAQNDSKYDDSRYNELIQKAGVDESYFIIVNDLALAGFSTDLDNARYERVGSVRHPETGENIPGVERLLVPVKDASQREMALVIYAIAGNGGSGVVIQRTADDENDLKLNELLDALDAISQESEENQHPMIRASGPGCYPWTCYFYSRRIWTWECLDLDLSGGWAMVPAYVTGYSEWSDCRDFAWFADYRGYGIACPSHNTGKHEMRRVCCSGLPCG